MASINKNILANAVGRGWSVISVFIFIPIYISLLGPKMYGVISFYIILQGLLLFADAGLTATLRRELAKGNDSPDSRSYKYKILRSIELVYFLIITTIIVGIILCSNYIVRYWLNIEDLDVKATIQGVQLMGVALGLNFLSTLYQGGILGLEKQVSSNVFQITWGLVKNGGVIIAILFFEKTLKVFFLWQVVINFIYILVLRYYIFFLLKKNENLIWNVSSDFKILKNVWKYAAGMFLISIIAALNSQFDKLVLSRFLSVSDLTVYTLAYSIAMAPVILSGPISVAIFPRFVKFFDTGRENDLGAAFNNSFKLVLLLTGTAGIVLVCYTNMFLFLWTQNRELSLSAVTPAIFLLIGQTLLSFQVVPFNLALAKGNTKINIVIGLIGLLLLIPMVIIMALKWGMFGASLSWLIFSSIVTPIYIIVVVRKMTDFHILPWFLSNLLKPLLLLVVGNLVFYFLKPEFISEPIYLLIYALLTTSIVLFVTFNITYKVKAKHTISFIKHELFG